VCAEQKKCGYCEETEEQVRHSHRRGQWWRFFFCPCGKAHYLCEPCYEDFRDRKIIIRRGQRGGGKKEFLKACPKEVRVAEVLMKEDRKVDWEVTNP